jgi:hypothetical protein
MPGSRASWNRFAGKGGKGPGAPSPGKKSQLEPSRDEKTMGRDKEKPIPYVMEEDQQPTE